MCQPENSDDAKIINHLVTGKLLGPKGTKDAIRHLKECPECRNEYRLKFTKNRAQVIKNISHKLTSRQKKDGAEQTPISALDKIFDLNYATP